MAEGDSQIIPLYVQNAVIGGIAINEEQKAALMLLVPNFEDRFLHFKVTRHWRRRSCLPLLWIGNFKAREKFV